MVYAQPSAEAGTLGLVVSSSPTVMAPTRTLARNPRAVRGLGASDAASAPHAGRCQLLFSPELAGDESAAKPTINALLLHKAERSIEADKLRATKLRAKNRARLLAQGKGGGLGRLMPSESEQAVKPTDEETVLEEFLKGKSVATPLSPGGRSPGADARAQQVLSAALDMRKHTAIAEKSLQSAQGARVRLARARGEREPNPSSVVAHEGAAAEHTPSAEMAASDGHAPTTSRRWARLRAALRREMLNPDSLQLLRTNNRAKVAAAETADKAIVRIVETNSV